MLHQRSEQVKNPYQQAARWLWQRCCSTEILLGLVLLLVLALTTSYTFPQVPAYVRADPVHYQEWRSVIQARFKNWTSLLEPLGIFYVQDTLWFRILEALVAFVLIISFGNQIGLIAERRGIQKPELYYRAHDAMSFSGTAPAAQAVEHVQEAIRTFCGHVQRAVDGETNYLYASRGTWAMASTLMVYLGLLIGISGLAINGRWGWRQTAIQLLPGLPVPVGPEAAHTIQLVDVQRETGMVTLQVSDKQFVSVYPERNTRQSRFRYQLTGEGGPIVQIRASQQDQTPLTLYRYTARPQPAESLQFTFSPGQDADHFFIVSDQQVVGRLQWENPERPEQVPHFYLWILSEDGKAQIGKTDISEASQATTVSIGDTTYELDISRYVVLNVSYQPGLWALGIGGVMAAIGLAGTLVPRYQVWSMVTPQPDGATVRIREQRQGLFHRIKERQDEIWTELGARIEGA